MRGAEFAELKAFAAVASRLSFSRAAEQMGMSPSALSQTIRGLEERLGVRLLNRTTRTVALTEAGSRLHARIMPLFDAFTEALDEINEARDKPAGTLRLCAPQMAILHVLQPMLPRFQEEYPDIVLDITSDDSFGDIVSRGFDAGIRLGSFIEQDMIAVRISDPVRQIAVASPAYVEKRGVPETPADLLRHQCINWRRPGRLDVYSWQFKKDEQSFDMVVKGSLIVNDCAVALQSAIDGLGITVWTEEWMECELESGRLVRLLDDWSPPLSAFYLYHPSRVQMPATLRAFIDMTRRSRGDQPV
jgi:DNA-binding transcriptional LysR family regulator